MRGRHPSSTALRNNRYATGPPDSFNFMDKMMPDKCRKDEMARLRQAHVKVAVLERTKKEDENFVLFFISAMALTSF
ncbi:Hypothetical protein HEAR3237 [Herminiimonas arsenicoxydans]|uniref:Uncharacterized protein n=1 Tax=Herminiimonas arsenicoxydans TaxID=204773 RepID=A4GA07_HERAR|nr:Hypothetical protein HEAR3237 [Herminiimonas arsenicoxydans]